jgi:hypothetical protein
MLENDRRARQRLVAAAIAGAAATVLIAACTAVSPASPANQAAASGAPAPSGRVHLTDYEANSDGPDSSVILTGAVGDYGQAVSVYPDGKTDPGHTSELELSLKHGTCSGILLGDRDHR